MLTPPAQFQVPVDLQQPYTVEHLKSILKNQKNTAPGPDGLPWPALKQAPDEFYERLIKLFDAVEFSGHYPASWKQGRIVYIPKPGKDSSIPTNLRPITLLNTLGKLFEKAWLPRFRAETHNINPIPITQFGFRAGLSCETALHLITQRLTDGFNSKKVAVAAFLDIEKAYDRLWHEGLVYKMHTLGFRPTTTRLIHNYLSQRTSQATYLNCISRAFPLRAGTPQGAPSSCDLFNLFISDTPPPTNNRTTFVQQFADDTTLYSIHNSVPAAEAQLQSYITHRLEPWLRTWRIGVNPDKSVLIKFHHFSSKKHQMSDPRITLHQTPIPLQKSTKYLGMRLTNTLNWSVHSSEVRHKAYLRMNLLKMLRARGKGTCQQTLLHTYKTYIRPALEYASAIPVTAPTHTYIPKLCSAERNIVRHSLGMNPMYPTAWLYDDLGLDHITTRILTHRAKYMQRLLLRSPPVLPALISTPTRRTRYPKLKYIQPTAVAIANLRTHLPEQLQELLDAQNIITPEVQAYLNWDALNHLDQHLT